MKKCDLYEVINKEKKILKCLACNHKCFIGLGETGICGVRKNINGVLNLLVYSKPVSMNVDPIEKKPIYKFLSGTKTYSIGTVGCNFKCDFCQNWDISQRGFQDLGFGFEMSPFEIVNEAIVSLCKSISYTYNEPIIFIEYVRDCCILAKEKGLKNIMVSNGFWSKDAFNYIKNYIDCVNIDLKGNELFYKKYCGGSQEAVLETIKRCYESGMHVEITTLVIPGVNDNVEDFLFIAKFIAGIDKKIPWHITRFFPMYKMSNHNPTDYDVLEKAKEIGEKYLENVYLGNV